MTPTDPTLVPFSRMCEIRFFEERVLKLRTEGQVVGSVHLCNGQEAVYVGAAAALRSGLDAVFPTYRGHGWAIALGSDLFELFCELLGREAGTNGGRGGSAYLSDPDHDMYGENSIVGAAAPIAAGAALAARYDGSGRVAVASFGDGAINQGSVNETFNFAAVLRLPMIFVIENNGWSEMTPISATTAVPRLFKRATAFGMTGWRVNGHDAEAMEESVRSALRLIDKGRGPVAIEAMTDRVVGHYIGDMQAYRPADDIATAKARESLVFERERLLGRGVAQRDIERAEQQARDAVEDAAKRALDAPPARTDGVLEHLYA